MASGIVGGITTYGIVSSLQAEVMNLKQVNEESEAEIHQQIEKDKSQKMIDRRQWKVFNEKIENVREHWLQHDRWIHSFHGKDILRDK